MAEPPPAARWLAAVVAAARRKWASEQQKFYEQQTVAAQPASLASDDLEALQYSQVRMGGVRCAVCCTTAMEE